MRALLILFLLAGCASPFPQPHYERPPSTPTSSLNRIDWLGPKPTLEDFDQYVENFRKLAFHTERNGAWPYIKKWKGDRVCPPEKYRGYVEDTLKKLRVATSILYRNVSDSCDVVLEDEPYMRGCAFGPGRVSVGRGVETAECIEEELSQLSGLYNDINYPWTMWNDNNSDTVNRLTWHDAVMLRVLYQNELYQSMPESEAMQIVPRLMRKVILEIQ